MAADRFRFQAGILTLLFAITVVSIVLGTLFAGGSAWFWFLLLFIDLPALIVLGIVEWMDRARE